MTKKRRLWVSITFLLLASIVLTISTTACKRPSPGPSDEVSTKPPTPTEPIKIGVPTPLSPPADFKAGQINVNTLKLAANEVNRLGGVLGRQIELVIGDDEGNASKGVSLVQKMITQDKVSAILGVWHGSVALAQAKVAAQYKVPIIIHYSWPDEITAEHSDYIFRIGPFNSEIAQLLVPFIKEKGYKHVAVMAEDSSYGLGFSEALKKEGQKEGFQVTVKVFPSQALDLRPQLLELKNMSPRPDLLIVASVYQPMYLIPKQAFEVGLAPQTQVMAGWDYPGWSAEFWKTVGQAGKGIMYPAFYHAEMTLTERGKKFKEAYTQEYKESPPIYAYFLYDAL